MILLLFKLL